LRLRPTILSGILPNINDTRGAIGIMHHRHPRTLEPGRHRRPPTPAAPRGLGQRHGGEWGNNSLAPGFWAVVWLMAPRRSARSDAHTTSTATSSSVGGFWDVGASPSGDGRRRRPGFGRGDEGGGASGDGGGVRVLVLVAVVPLVAPATLGAGAGGGAPPSPSPSHFTEHDTYDQELGRPMGVKG